MSRSQKLTAILLLCTLKILLHNLQETYSPWNHSLQTSHSIMKPSPSYGCRQRQYFVSAIFCLMLMRKPVAPLVLGMYFNVRWRHLQISNSRLMYQSLKGYCTTFYSTEKKSIGREWKNSLTYDTHPWVVALSWNSMQPQNLLFEHLSVLYSCLQVNHPTPTLTSFGTVQHGMLSLKDPSWRNCWSIIVFGRI